MAVPSTVNAAVISGITAFNLPGFSTGSLTYTLPGAPNNDNATGVSPNAVGFSIFFNTFGTAEFEFAVTASGGTTEYRFGPPLVGLPIGIVNNTGVPWTDFHFELGYGTGAGFVRSSATDLLDFDTPDKDPAPTSSVFPILSHQADVLDWSGATVPSVGSVNFVFFVDVPDGIDRFTLRLMPTATAVPEPASLFLLALGTVGALARRRVSAR